MLELLWLVPAIPFGGAFVLVTLGRGFRERSLRL